jgi:chemotaxis protein MotB
MEDLKDSQDNFWISYADLMAGLLFIFILVIGAIIVKHNYMTSEFTKQKKSIEKLEERAKKKEEAAEKLKQELLEQKKSMEELSLKAKEKEEAVEKLKEELDITKKTIYKLTSVKLNVIEKLRQKLGDKIEVDPKSGALRISGNILFQQDQDTLIESSKKTLTSILSEYIKVLMNDKEIKDNLDKIIIEGHTNSDGDYLHNLELSQKRALSVMKFLLTLQPENESELQKYVTANGRSETDLIMTNNEENKLDSRRIEIKFKLKNDEAISEISKMLGSK